MTPCRAGVTIIEVLFASGIAVFGLVGIASLLAVGGRQASDANGWSEGQTAAQFALSDFSVRGYDHSVNWRFYNDQRSSDDRFVNYLGVSPLARATTATGMRTANRYAVCIDPYFFSDATTLNNLNNSFPPLDASNNFQRYRPGLFPYYQDDFDPMNPAAGLGGNAGRLLRVSLRVGNGQLSSKAIDRLFQFQDDLAVTTSEQNLNLPGDSDDDTTLPAQRVMNFLPSGVAQGKVEGKYSWFATLCPRELTASEQSDLTLSLNKIGSPENLFTLSIVVCKNRDRTFYIPSPGEQGPQGERVVSVLVPNDPTTGLPINPYRFNGGSGGLVTLSACLDEDGINPNWNISDSLRPGDWVMLCREQPLNSDGSGGLSTICRWYRILTADLDPAFGTSPDTWSRTVVLDGPDWVFDANYPTQATLVSGVVTVVERAIRVQ